MPTKGKKREQRVEQVDHTEIEGHPRQIEQDAGGWARQEGADGIEVAQRLHALREPSPAEREPHDGPVDASAQSRIN